MLIVQNIEFVFLKVGLLEFQFGISLLIFYRYYQWERTASVVYTDKSRSSCRQNRYD